MKSLASRLVAVFFGLCAAGPSMASDPADWSPQQWETLFATAQHTAGSASYVYRQATTTDAEQARRWSRFGGLGGNGFEVDARHLIDVPPALRFALQSLYQPDDVSAPVLRTLPDGGQEWTVLMLVRRGDASRLVLDPGFRDSAAAWVASGLLPDPEQLSAPAAQARIAYWRAVNAEQIASVPPTLSADVEFGDLGTPLISAVIRKDFDAAKSLVERGADLNRCAARGCPITLAAMMPNASESEAWVDWMLKNGARPDITDPRGLSVFTTALAGAAWRGHRDVAKRLIDGGASVNGVPNAITTPVEAAAMRGNKPLIEWLMARGASVLPRVAPKGFGVSSIYAAMQGVDDTDLPSWAEKTMVQAATARPEYRFEVYFEQAGRRIDADRHGGVQLKAAPFNMVFSLADDAGGVQVGSSFDATWLDEIKTADLRNPMVRPLASVALTDVSRPDSDYLMLSRSCPGGAAADPGCDGAPMYFSIDPHARNDFHERRTQDGKAYVRTVSRVVVGGAQELPLARLDGKTLYIATAVPLALGGPDGARLIQPKFLSVTFVR